MSEYAVDMTALSEKIQQSSSFIDDIRTELDKVVIGQKYMIDRLMIGLLTNGHVLLEGVPGLAKTLTISSLATVIDTAFQRIQFTPDLLPADLIGTLIYNQKEGDFFVKKGPIFANIILADEINRSPAKVQSALLEAMQEKQVTIGACVRHQNMAGSDMGDDHKEYFSGEAALKAGGADNTMNQFG